MRNFVFISFVLSCFFWQGANAAPAAKAAEVVYVTGSVKADGVQLSKGDAIAVGSKIQTLSDGYLYMRTIDNGFLVVRSNSNLEIRSYSIDVKTAVQIKIELISGAARSITGSAAQENKDGFRFNTPVAAIGVRGTDFTVQTSEVETLVAVASGGVAVSPLNEACQASGFGPCSGDFVADLFAADSGFLRVLRGAVAPELIKRPAAAPSLPIPAEAPPQVKGSPELSPVFEQDLPLVTSAVPESKREEPPVQVSSITWGRWQKIADAEPDSALFSEAANNAGHYGLRVLGSHFLASQVDRQYTRPVESQIVFGASKFDAYLGLAGGIPSAANVSNAALTINFDKREFVSAFNVSNQIGSMIVNASGSVGNLGNLEGGIIGSNAKLVGYLEGEGAVSASTLFNTHGGNPLSASGFIQWAR